MKKIFGILLILIMIGFPTGACKKTDEGVEAEPLSKEEPEHVTVQHILIAFQGSISDEKVTRTREEAERLASEIFKRAEQGEDFDALVKEYTDDQYPGIYRMSNTGVEPRAEGEYSRTRMVAAFGDVGFALEVNGIGIANHSQDKSPFGWHIIKRIE